jgi:hypothetical protein
MNIYWHKPGVTSYIHRCKRSSANEFYLIFYFNFTAKAKAFAHWWIATRRLRKTALKYKGHLGIWGFCDNKSPVWECERGAVDGGFL